LAVLALFGRSAEVRRAATETLTHRNPTQYADLLIGLLRDPLVYAAHPVGGPGAPGSLLLKGPTFHIERVYAPPPPPDLPIFPGENVTFDPQGLPIIIRHTDETTLDFAWQYWGYIYPSRCVISPHLAVTIQLGQMWLEDWKSAWSAQRQLDDDVSEVERSNDIVRATNAQVALLLGQATGAKVPPNRQAWQAWWAGRLGKSYVPESEPMRPTLVNVVPLDYVPQNVGGLNFDPQVGYYLRYDVHW
jgi:hypothetical protein